jgi:hypothetical protein
MIKIMSKIKTRRSPLPACQGGPAPPHWGAQSLGQPVSLFIKLPRNGVDGSGTPVPTLLWRVRDGEYGLARKTGR